MALVYMMHPSASFDEEEEPLLSVKWCLFITIICQAKWVWIPLFPIHTTPAKGFALKMASGAEAKWKHCSWEWAENNAVRWGENTEQEGFHQSCKDRDIWGLQSFTIFFLEIAWGFPMHWKYLWVWLPAHQLFYLQNGRKLLLSMERHWQVRCWKAVKRQVSKTQSSRLINVFKPQCSIVSLLSAVDKG